MIIRFFSLLIKIEKNFNSKFRKFYLLKIQDYIFHYIKYNNCKIFHKILK